MKREHRTTLLLPQTPPYNDSTYSKKLKMHYKKLCLGQIFSPFHNVKKIKHALFSLTSNLAFVLKKNKTKTKQKAKKKRKKKKLKRSTWTLCPT